MAKKIHLLWVIFAIVLFLVYAWTTKDTLRVVTCDVGQGDGIILIHKYNEVVIDAGNSDKMLECMARYFPFGDRTIELFILTHADADHAAGVESILNIYKVEQIVTNSAVVHASEMEEEKLPATLTKTERSLIHAMKNEEKYDGASVSSASVGSEQTIGGMHIRYIWPQVGVTDTHNESSNESAILLDEQANIKNERTKSGIDDNNDSIVFELKFGDFNALFTGDLEVPEEERILAQTEKTLSFSQNITLLKVTHHGSQNGTSDAFVSRIQPRISVISVGEKNRYHHPSQTVIDRLEKMNSRVFETDRDGTVCIATNGKAVWRMLPFAQREEILSTL